MGQLPDVGSCELLAVLDRVPGTLTATIHSGAGEAGPGSVAARAAARLRERAGRLVYNGFPTGVAVTWAMQHGGPYPSATFASHTSVGTAAIRRSLRPVTYQDAPVGLLPPELREDNSLAPTAPGGRQIPAGMSERLQTRQWRCGTRVLLAWVRSPVLSPGSATDNVENLDK